jgi:lysyl-tRNA synthetase class II
MNEESFDRFKFRSDFIKAIREFYWKQDFIEIETPVL